VRVVARALEKPSGKISLVFKSARERSAAYDFVESSHVPIGKLEEEVGRATARSCAARGRVRVAVDGSSATVVDKGRSKGLGRLGPDTAGARGLKVMTALAVGADGGSIGVLGQSFWVRPDAPKRSRRRKQRERVRKTPQQKETGYWLQTIQRAATRLDEANVLGWFQLDREGDGWATLLALTSSGHWFTVRSAWDRVVTDTGRDKHYLRAQMAATPSTTSYELDVPASAKRKARRAHMVLRAANMTLRLQDKRNGRKHLLPVHVVWVREHGTTPRGEKPIDWMLLTNAPIDTAAHARDVVIGYATRWRIEDFHKTWKSGACDVESTQLRSPDAVIRWATILAVVAARIERLKHLSRSEPTRPASDELTAVEIEVLIALKRRYKGRSEIVPAGVPDIATAVRWIAELGGYTGKSSGGPPGAITIGRGLDDLRAGVEAVLALRAPK
jgi:Transposase DDE domain